MPATFLSSGKKVVNRILGEGSTESLARGVHVCLDAGKAASEQAEKIWWQTQGGIPFMKPFWGPREFALLKDPDAFGRRTDLVSLESKFRRALSLDDSQDLAFTGSGRTATELALRVLKQKYPGRDQVILPSYGCRGNWDPVIKTGLKPVLADIDHDLLTPPAEIIGLMSQRTLACVLVHLCGKRMDTDGIIAAARKRGVFTIADQCQNLGSPLLFEDQGPTADFTIHSFGLGKNLMATAGGAVISRVFGEELSAEAAKLGREDPALVKARVSGVVESYFPEQARGLGLTGQPAPGGEPSHHGYVTISAPDAQLLRAQLDSLPRVLGGRINNAGVLREVMGKYPGVYGMQTPGRHIYTKLSVILQSLYLVPLFRSFMARRNLELETMYTPLHLQDFAAEFARPLPVCEDLYLRVFNLAVRPNLKEKELQRIAAALDKFGKKYEKAAVTG